MTQLRTLLLSSAALVALGLPANAFSDATPYRVPTSDPNTDQVCFYLPGNATPAVCDRQVNKTTGGTTALPGLVAGVPADPMTVLPSGASNRRTMSAKFDDLAVSVNDFGADPTCSTTSGAAFQAAETYVASRGGGRIRIPWGFYCFGPTETVAVNASVYWVGDGRGINAGAGYIGGSLIRTSNPTGNVFTVATRAAVKFSDFAIDGYGVAGGKTAGAAISLEGDVEYPAAPTSPQADYNINSEITGMYFGGGLYDDVKVRAAINWTFSGNVLQDYKNFGFALIGDYGSNPDGSTGQSHIVGNTIHALNTASSAQAGVVYDAGGDIEVVGNKIIGGRYNIWISLAARTNTGTFIIADNSLEEVTTNHIRAERGTTTATFANVVVTGNQFSSLANETGFQGVFATIQSGSTDWLQNVTFVGNVLNMGITAPVAMVSIRAGRGVVVAHNTITALGNTGSWAFDSGGTATKVLFDENEVHDMPSGIYNTVGSNAVVHDTINGADASAGLIFSGLGAFANGSELYIKDGACTSGSLAGGGTGAFARRVGGAWKC